MQGLFNATPLSNKGSVFLFHSFLSSVMLFPSLFELVDPQLDKLTCLNLWVIRKNNRMGIQLELTRINYEKQ